MKNIKQIKEKAFILASLLDLKYGHLSFDDDGRLWWHEHNPKYKTNEGIWVCKSCDAEELLTEKEICVQISKAPENLITGYNNYCWSIK